MSETNLLAEKAMSRATTRLLPFLILMYVMSFLDRSNIGFAKNFLATDVGITPEAFALGAGLFFFGYSFFEIPSNMIMHYVGARRWMARIMITWGLCAAGFAWVSSETSFLVLRVLLGIAEAGFFPGVVVFMTYWFTKEKRAKINGLFYYSTPLAFIIGGPLSGALIEYTHGWGGWHGWQWMFAVEGFGASLVGIIALFYLTDNPDKAAWMPDEEKTALAAALEAERDQHGTKKHGNPLMILLYPKVVFLCCCYFCFNWGFYGANFYMPTQVAAFMGSEVNFLVGMVSTVPWLISCAFIFYFTNRSHTTGNCATIVSLCMFLSGCGIVLSSVSNPYLGILGLGFGVGGIMAAMPIFWTIPARFLSGLELALAVAMVNSVGVLGGWCAPIVRQWFTSHVAPEWGLYSLAVPPFIVSGLVLVTIRMGIGSNVLTPSRASG